MAHHYTTDWQGKMLGRYRVVQFLGRGGMGEVWQAEDTTLHRPVAIKLLPAVLRSDHHYLQDFTYEAMAAAALEHPHILPIHDYGKHSFSTDELVTYLVMPYITGGSLRDRLRSVRGSLPLAQILHYLRQAAEAIDYAHSQSVLHRDIKPANMLLQQDWLLLADFGLAKLLSSEAHRSKTHAGDGTPEYMAPEQAQGKAEAASDRYSFAVIAYQLFTGRLPFLGDTAYETLIKQMKEMPTAPRRLNPTIPLHVEQTLLRGLAKRPADRPHSCASFVQELEQGLRTPEADPEATLIAPWNKRLTTLSGKHKAIELVPLTAPATPATPSTPLTTNTISAPNNPATQPLQNTRTGTDFSTRAMFTSQETAPPTAPLNMSSPNTPFIPNTPAIVANSQTQIPPRKIGRRELLIGGAAAAVVVGVGGLMLTNSLKYTPLPAPLRPPAPGPRTFMPGVPVLGLTAHSDTVWNAVWDSTSSYLATAGEDTRVMLWNVGEALQQKQSRVQVVQHPQGQWKFGQKILGESLCWVNGHSLAVTTAEYYRFYVIDTGKKDTYQTYEDAINQAVINAGGFKFDAYNHVSWSPQANMLAISVLPTPYTVKVDLWSMKNTQEPLRTLKYEKAPKNTYVGETRWSPDGTHLMGILNNSTLIIWDVAKGTVQTTLALPIRTKQQTVFVLRDSLLWSTADLNQILVSDIDVLTVWDIRQKTPLQVLGTDDPDTLKNPAKKSDANFIQNVTGTAWSPNGRYVAASYGRSQKVYVWDLQDQAPQLTKDGVHLPTYVFGETGGHRDTIIDLQWSPDGRYLATTSFDKTIIVWKVDAA